MPQETYIRQPDGLYHIDCGANRILKTPLTPINTSTMTTWAQGLLQQAQDAIDYGFGLCVDGTEYDLSNFMCDTHGGEVPWDPDSYNQLYAELQKQPNFVQVLDDFYKKYGEPYFYKTWEENNRACNGEDVPYSLT